MTPDLSYTTALGGLERNASITINGMGKRKEVKCITAAAAIIRYSCKLHRSTRSGLTAVVLCKWSTYVQLL